MVAVLVAVGLFALPSFGLFVLAAAVVLAISLLLVQFGGPRR